MAEQQLQSQLERVRLDAEMQAQFIEIAPLDLNERGERYAVAGGAPSGLPEHLWKLVRTDAFKQWYGDWQHAPVEQFQTAHGSVYTYDSEGCTTRYKTATGEQHATQDITVFVDLSASEEQVFLAAYRRAGFMLDGERVRVYVTEILDTGAGKIVRSRGEVTNPERLMLTILTDKKRAVRVKRASLQPAEGLITFDTRHFVEEGVTYTERHLGNEVVKIDYRQSAVSQMLKNGEPLLLRDPRSTDERDYCFVRTVNPLKMDRQSYDQWSVQFGIGDDRIARIREALWQDGFDGLFIDGQPAPVFSDEQMLRVSA